MRAESETVAALVLARKLATLPAEESPLPRKRGLGGTCADDARPVESRSADFVLDVGHAGRVYCPDLLEPERPAVETRE